MRNLILKKRGPCQHYEVHEIGQDYDKDGNPVRLVRCQVCGLLMREDAPLLQTVTTQILET